MTIPFQPGSPGGAVVDERGNVIGVESSRFDFAAAVHGLPQNVNYAADSSTLLKFLESVPAVSAKLKKPNATECGTAEVVESAQKATVLVVAH